MPSKYSVGDIVKLVNDPESRLQHPNYYRMYDERNLWNQLFEITRSIEYTTPNPYCYSLNIDCPGNFFRDSELELVYPC